MIRLVSLNEAEQLRDREFQDYVEKSHTLIEQWKQYYGYSASDSRYTEATEAQILTDIIRIKVNEHRQRFETGNETMDEFAKKRVLEPDYEKKWKAQADKAIREQLSNG